MTFLIILVVSLTASMLGAVCGIGGGVVIKPVLDSLGVMDVTTISFLSGITVLAMTLYSVSTNLRSGRTPFRLQICIPVSFGSAIGGMIGKGCFNHIKELFSDTEFVGVIQSLCLCLLTLATLIYTVYKQKIKTKYITSTGVCFIVGLVLGVFSSFLGIGGGPFNLVFLSFFFSMETKEAAQTSLFIILFSQVTSLCFTIVTKQVPEIDYAIMVGMICTGIGVFVAYTVFLQAAL